MTGTLALLEAAVELGVARFVFTSTTSAFFRRLSLKAPRNWVAKNGPKRFSLRRRNWLMRGGLEVALYAYVVQGIEPTVLLMSLPTVRPCTRMENSTTT